MFHSRSARTRAAGRNLARPALAGFILSGLSGSRTFLVERENDCWGGLLLAPGDKSAI